MQSFVKDVYWRPDNVLGNGENHVPVPVPATKTYLAYSKCQMNLFFNLLTPHFPPHLLILFPIYLNLFY